MPLKLRTNHELDALDEIERMRPHRAELDALRSRRDEAGWHPVSDAELLRMVELGVGDPSSGTTQIQPTAL